MRMYKSKYFLSLVCCAFVACNNDDDEKVEENKTNDESLLLENTYKGDTVAEQRQKAIDEIEKLKKELEKQNYDLIDGTLAPAPFNQMEPEFKAKKWYIYRTTLS